VVSTLRDLIASGDEIVRIEASCPGRSAIVQTPSTAPCRQARWCATRTRWGSRTEPREDLSGRRREKLLILGRQNCLRIDLDEVKVDSLCPSAGARPSTTGFLRRRASRRADGPSA